MGQHSECVSSPGTPGALIMTTDPLHVVREHPLCAETPAAQLPQPLTPAASVYVRSNFDTPVFDATHRITVGGAVDAPLSFPVSDLDSMRQHAVVMTLECAGNGRLGMDPVPPGEPWGFGAVSTTVWSGVPLSMILERAGVQDGVVEVLATAADHGLRDDAIVEGSSRESACRDVRFARSLPLHVAMHPDTLVATHMAGAPLTEAHGAPVRLIVPGWYGMASVKWLASLELLTVPFTGYFQRQRYVYDTGDQIEPVTTARVKSMITTPLPDSHSGREVVVRGWAWSGAGGITRVEVGVNTGAGETWRDAEIGTPASRYAWTPFSLPLVLPPAADNAASRAVTLRTRATDASGATQPEQITWNRLGYGNNAIRGCTIHVVS
jgi:DMSO/TMAO reductase YedYZ molybdopterin-dependent catalytic subunit